MTSHETAQILAICSAAFPHISITKETVAVYAEMLADLEFSSTQRALKRVLATSQFFPTIAAIRDAYAAVTGIKPPSTDEAWAEVIRAVRAIGVNGMPTWSHPTVQTTVAALGWREICMSENQSIIRAHFIKLYESASKATVELALPKNARRALPE